MTRDPQGFVDGMNLYVFLKNNPYRYADPNGEFVVALPLLYLGAEGITIAITASTVVKTALVAAALWAGWEVGHYVNQNATEADQKPVSNGEEKNEDDKKKKGRSDKLRPDPIATGAHDTYKVDPKTGEVTHYEEWRPQTNPYSPQKWESVKRYDGPRSPAHFNDKTQEYVRTPHVHDSKTPGGVRPAENWEIPQKGF